MDFYTAEEIEDQIETYLAEDEDTQKILGSQSAFSGMLQGMINVIKRMFVEVVWAFMLETFNSIFYSTSEKEALILHLKDEGLTPWKVAKKSSGTVRIGSTSLPDGKVDIPLRSVVKTADVVPKYYITTEASSIDEDTAVDSNGNYTVEVAIESIEKGGDYNVASGAICELDSSLDGIDYVNNDDQTFDGRDEETKDEVRDRLIDRNVGKTEKTRSWFVSETKDNFDWVVACECIPRYAGRGTVGVAVRVAGGVDPTQEQLDSVEAFFNTNEKDPSGAWTVFATKIDSYIWDATIKIYYIDENDIPSDDVLYTALKEYFSGLEDGDEIIEDWIRMSIITNVNNIKKIEIITHSGYETPDGYYPILGTITWQKAKYE